MRSLQQLSRTGVLILGALCHVPAVGFAADGTTLITQLKAVTGTVGPGDAPGFPITIATPGSYTLATNIYVGLECVPAIEITASNVTLNLNGFEIAKHAASVDCDASGVYAPYPTDNVVLLNGTIRAMPRWAVEINNGRIEGIRAVDNAAGLFLWRGGIVVRNEVRGNGRHSPGAPLDYASLGIGVRCLYASCAIRENLVANNSGTGISASRCNVHSNTVTHNGGVGFFDESGRSCRLAENFFTDNNLSAPFPQAQIKGGLNAGGNICSQASCF
jgi:hypothetical protein